MTKKQWLPLIALFILTLILIPFIYSQQQIRKESRGKALQEVQQKIIETEALLNQYRGIQTAWALSDADSVGIPWR